MLDPYDNKKEIAKSGSEALLGDSLYRTAHNSSFRDGERLFKEDPLLEGMCYELFYTAYPESPFGALDAYFELECADDETFARLAPQLLDMDSFLGYMLFIQATGNYDTVHNNMYLWAHKQGGNYLYRVLPWDLDLGWGLDMGSQMQRWIQFNTVDRMLRLNAGDARGRMQQIWNEMKENGFSVEAIEAIRTQYMHELNDSGAFMREYERWERSAGYADNSSILEYCSMRFDVLDSTIQEMTIDPQAEIAFLEGAEYRIYNPPIVLIFE